MSPEMRDNPWANAYAQTLRSRLGWAAAPTAGSSVVTPAMALKAGVPEGHPYISGQGIDYAAPATEPPTGRLRPRWGRLAVLAGLLLWAGQDTLQRRASRRAAGAARPGPPSKRAPKPKYSGQAAGSPGTRVAGKPFGALASGRDRAHSRQRSPR